MKRKLLPVQQRRLNTLGENIKLARLRRNLSAQQVAERADISRTTLSKVEKGEEGVAFGSIYRVLIVLGLDQDILQIAKDDQLGRALQDAQIRIPRRAPKTTTR